ncbi:MAG: ATP-dependent RNA helicase HrpA [Acidimicrobiia bacterium]|nr:ATP-dependent RNA helicase HrpA [Acidimicrobiia bacterium]
MSDLSHLRAHLDELSTRDRARFLKRIGGAERIKQAGRRQEVLKRIEADLDRAVEARSRRIHAAPSKVEYPAELPIVERLEDLAAAIAANQVVVVAGETGSGKSTQLPKLCLEMGRGVDGLIGHTQPRRIAARSIAERVATELGSTVGDLVGFKIRFTDQVGDRSLIKVMTDGVLLAEIHNDPDLLAYDTIIIDEAHERSLNIDFLLGYLHSLLRRRPDLKLIITSATIDTERFAEHFDAPVVEVSGRTHPVEIRYRPPIDNQDQPQAICDAVIELVGAGDGDILVFCSGEREIRDAADALGELELRHTEILPLYGRLSSTDQHRVFAPHTGRRIVLATNVAETSITVPGVRFVIDPGTARISRSGRTGVQRLPIEPVSQASANQRAGRCGRLGPGICVRLYSEADFEARPEFTEPEILRTNLASVLLKMAALDLGSIDAFPFLDPPDRRAVRQGILLLEELGATTGRRERIELTALGRRMAVFPIDPRLARVLIEADRNGCLREMLVLTAALSIQDPRERPLDQREAADAKHRRFADSTSDLLGMLALWNHVMTERRERSSNAFRRMCRDEFLNYRRVREWQDIRSQLRGYANDLGLTMNRKPATPDAIHRTMLTGFLSHIGHKDPKSFEYHGARGIRFAIAPGSTLFKQAPEWVMAVDLVETSRLWARGVARIDPAWIETAGAHMVVRTHSEPWWDADRGAAVARETVTMLGLRLSADRTVGYGRIDAAASRDLFIRHALVLGEWSSHHDFVRHNADVLEQAEATATRERRFDLLVGDEALAGFFDARVPPDVFDTRRFDRWWRDQRTETPTLLDLTLDDVFDPAADRANSDQFPEVWRHGDLELPIHYEFDPSSPSDGVTIDLTLDQVDRVDPSVFEWQVPGLRAELIDALVRSLPKALRKLFLPIGDTVQAVLGRLEPGTEGLFVALRRELTRIAGTPIGPDAFDLDRVPEHLRPLIRIIGDNGEVLASGPDLRRLRDGLDSPARRDESTHPLEQSGLTKWSFGELPQEVRVGVPGQQIRAFPALSDDGDSVSIRLTPTIADQRRTSRAGLRRLVLLQLPSPAKLLRHVLDDRARALIRIGPYDTPSRWVEDCLGAAVDEVIDRGGGPVWDGRAFDRLLTVVKDQLADTVASVAEHSLAVLEALWDLGLAVDEAPVAASDAIDDVAAQANQLIYPDFVTGVGAGRLADVARYLRAAEHRLHKLASRPERDRAAMEEIRALETEFDRTVEAIGTSPELTVIAWQLQELRVSLFAQHLGTREAVSAKRIRRALEQATR